MLVTHVLTAGSPPLRLILVKEGFVWSSVSGLFISCQFQYLHETPAYLNQKIPWTPLGSKKKVGVFHTFSTNQQKSETKKTEKQWKMGSRSRVFLTVADADTLFGSWQLSRRPFRCFSRVGWEAPWLNDWGFTHNIWARWLTKVQGCLWNGDFSGLCCFEINCHVPGDSAGDLFVDGDLWPFQRLFVTFN